MIAQNTQETIISFYFIFILFHWVRIREIKYKKIRKKHSIYFTFILFRAGCAADGLRVCPTDDKSRSDCVDSQTDPTHYSVIEHNPTQPGMDLIYIHL